MVRFGFVSTANVGRKNWAAIQRAGHTVTVIGSRDQAKAQLFIDDCQKLWPQSTEAVAVDSYDAVLSSPVVDVVYIPLPTAIRCEWVLKAAQHKKHVLCEKPCAITVAQLKEMIRVCEESGVQFLDCVAFTHGKRLPALVASLPDIGVLRRIQTSLCMVANEGFMTNNIRVRKELEPMGAFGDLGSYCIRGILHLMGDRLPSRVTGRILQATETGVPLEFSGEMLYDADNVTATMFCSYNVDWHADLTAYGTSGRITLRDFFSPLYSAEATSFVVGRIVNNYVDKRRRAAQVDSLKSVAESSDYQEEAIICAIARVASGEAPLNAKWPLQTLVTQIVMEGMLESASRESAAVPLLPTQL